VTSQREQILPALLDVASVEDTLGILPDDGTEPELALDQRQVTEIRPGVPQQIEGNKARLSTVEQQISGASRWAGDMVWKTLAVSRRRERGAEVTG